MRIKRERVSLLMEADMKQAIRERAKHEHRSLSNMLNIFLREGFNTHSRQRSRTKMAA